MVASTRTRSETLRQPQFVCATFRFAQVVDKTKACGDTALWDAAIEAAKQLAAKHRPGTDEVGGAGARAPTPLRILLLTDGRDTSSAAVAWELLQELLKHRIVLDVIAIADGTSNEDLLAISSITHGQCFCPETIAEALELCELETLLSLSQRPVIQPAAWKQPGPMQAMKQLLQDCLWGVGNDVEGLITAHRDALPARRQPAEMDLSSMSLEKAIQSSQAGAVQGDGAAPGAAAGVSRQRRLMSEIRKLSQHPHPNFDIFPTGTRPDSARRGLPAKGACCLRLRPCLCPLADHTSPLAPCPPARALAETNLSFWKVVMEAPDGCLYAGGTYLLTLDLTADYPAKPPLVRFAELTPIKHVNVNLHGRICHGILGRDWDSTMSVRDVLNCIFGLLLSPGTQSHR
jgi:ubiquitin-protein ligase